MVGVGVANLVREPARQLGLFDKEPRRDEKLERTLDEIRARFGRDAIQRASLKKERGADG